MWINNVRMNIYVYAYDCLNSKYIYNVWFNEIVYVSNTNWSTQIVVVVIRTHCRMNELVSKVV